MEQRSNMTSQGNMSSEPEDFFQEDFSMIVIYRTEGVQSLTRFTHREEHFVVFLLSRTGIFGQKLEDTVRYEKRYGNHLAPMLVEQCVDFIRLRGLKEEGLFRLPGQANLVKELQDAFDCGEKPLFDR
ncbi:hypothetical protein lerEdw1_002466 [Lerista edwardsae]|nr:hypothetical protein lerEdw1_002466 [Lerista edwardsae]